MLWLRLVKTYWMVDQFPAYAVVRKVKCPALVREFVQKLGLH